MSSRRPAGRAAPEAQLGLFGPAATAGIEAAQVSPEVNDVAARLPRAIRLGTSSWSFPGWAGIVWSGRHPADALSADGLAAYARHPLLRAVGVDRTFYAPLPAAALAAHAAQVPADFRFLVKASQLCTFPSLREGPGRGPPRANPRFLDPGFAAEAVVAPAVEGLGERLGTLLFQFPPLPRAETRDPARFAGRLGAFLEALPRGVPVAVEIRDAELLGPAYAAALDAGGASHGYTVHPSMPSLEAQAEVLPVERQPALVLRWMLGHGRGYEEARDLYAPFDRLAAPDPDTRASVAALVLRAVRAGKEGLVIVNNKAEGSSPLSIVEAAREIAAAAARPAPPR
ncbi:MAG TPA: DUF72 domain-containing protein [Anaeromyxobacteraceae bacterium]|nr:DUF72 domain-containing protein [Anaeromyxobacteraceae bacterium]